MEASKKATTMKQPINPVEVHGMRIAMVAWAVKPDGSDDVAVFTGTGDWNGTKLTLVRQPLESSFVLEDDWLPKLCPVPDELRETLLSADYYFSVTVGPLEENFSGPLKQLGIVWPND